MVARARSDRELTGHVQQVHAEHRGTYGVRRVAQAVSQQLGCVVNHKRVYRIMRDAGLQGATPRRKHRVPEGERPQPVANVLERDLNTTVSTEQQRWCGDITYIRSRFDWAYLATVIDIPIRRVVGWAVSDTPG